ncbi:hypothetical protein H5M68_004955, partial [Salmonella enterica]|nr:hypothetical protein [Salmonella enterica]
KFNGVHAYMTDNGFQAAAVAWFKGQF